MKAQKDLEKKIEEMTSTINKAVSKEATSYWRKHIPVYGWTKMNYPGTICGSLWNKYQKIKEDDQKKDSDELERQNLFSNGFDENEYSGMRKNTRSVNDIVESLKNVDPLEKFMKNYKENDLKNYQEIFNNYEKSKKGLVVDNIVPHNFNAKKDQNMKKYMIEMGQKASYIWLTTDPYEKKKDYVR
jgi:hypothetical protein